jgi:hypothetical protein
MCQCPVPLRLLNAEYNSEMMLWTAALVSKAVMNSVYDDKLFQLDVSEWVGGKSLCMQPGRARAAQIDGFSKYNYIF